MRVLTHPCNLDLVKRHCEAGTFGDHGPYGIEIVTNRYLDTDKPTGRYILPDGRVVRREEVVIPDGRFFEWGPGMSDTELKYLLSIGLLREEREPLFYVVQDSLLSRMFFDLPIIAPPKYLAIRSL